MRYDNNAARIRREVLIRICRQFREADFPEKLDRIPLEMRPLKGAAMRCCVHRDRAILRYRIMAILGFSVEAEEDELTPLAEYGRRALARSAATAPILTVIDEACHGCIRSQYLITNACHHCMARPCIINCPKKAIAMEGESAHIDEATCVNCGICAKVCPYHAVVRVPIPCEEACPVGAITTDEHGKEDIDYGKCIFCGKCQLACPFGAVMEKSMIVDVMQALAAKAPVVALLAPAIQGQFPADLARVTAALKALGFAEVVEVATGADHVARLEAEELLERAQGPTPLMTSSCCPAYTETVAKHVPELAPFVSRSRTPMHYTALWTKEANPEGVTVFVGPCVAKRKEALGDEAVDFVVTFEEIGALMVALDVDVQTCTPEPLDEGAHQEGRAFPISGGVTQAVKTLLDGKLDVEPALVDGLDKKSIKLLSAYAKGKCPGRFLEVMGCEGGCVAGPAVLGNVKRATKEIRTLCAKSKSIRND